MIFEVNRYTYITTKHVFLLGVHWTSDPIFGHFLDFFGKTFSKDYSFFGKPSELKRPGGIGKICPSEKTIVSPLKKTILLPEGRPKKVRQSVRKNRTPTGRLSDA